MEAIYDYICSPQFVHRLKAVVDHQEQMKVELDKERNAMLRKSDHLQVIFVSKA
ncbi:hypothetical protein PNIG_a2267 [Pseudoalteromonas nigrifaciens]|uniref:Uncharacterized protein n=1 Tax=Pseudoalteromonas nigrifaciens TaxID=28109 RepID=A0AAC9XXR6_9GAMM|nr:MULTISPECIES: hypothetical protein [Pseudoalteromonas]ASM54302.1 hypothetical protein PNIG_a2267 [Pseudoalteromonas nigrifaciens]GEN43358.1 hypothetical protein PNI02_28240 [Pseudoalteromonas nigrifaciens]SUC51873.1 Uncharacterised protein [Pseudoalteromonas nigrifaciens]|tara:strand:- start:812 stop:973 length:162 start_codon:yes stop_codon:yes gene_type:complete